MTDTTHIPALARGARLQFHPEEGAWVLQAGESRLLPDDIAAEVLQLVDGRRPIDTIVDLLSLRYEAPRDRIAADVIAILDRLAGRGAVEFREPARWKVSLSMLLLWLKLQMRRGSHA